MLILCVGLYRSGSTFQYQVAADLIERVYGGQRLGFVGPDLPDHEGWAVLKWHAPSAAYAAALGDGRARALYCYRDLRDVAFSLAHLGGRTFDQAVNEGYLEAVLAADAFWSGRLGTLVQRYEHIMQRPGIAIEQIAAFLGVELEGRDVSDLLERYGLEANRARQVAIASAARAAGLDLADPANTLFHDPVSQVHHNHIRTGAVGDWRRRATAEQRRVLGAWLGPWLIAHGYEPDDRWIEGDDGVAQTSPELGVRVRAALLKSIRTRPGLRGSSSLLTLVTKRLCTLRSR